LSDPIAEYTLLIVESPVLAKRLQCVAPDHVVVISTGGFLWTPIYDSITGKLGKKAIPDKLPLRNELRREATYAIKIIVATDSDPSGDFIAWTIHNDLKQSTILRGHLTSVSRSALLQLLLDASEIDFSALYKRLQNRFNIRHLWSEAYPGVSMKNAGLIALFGSPVEISTFRTDKNQTLQSEQPLSIMSIDSYIEIERSSETQWLTCLPLSTFDSVASLQQSSEGGSYSDAQNLLQKTYEATNPRTDEGLITYPRTEHRTFFDDTWHDLQKQWIKKRSINEFIPDTLRERLQSHEAHDALRPVNLNLTPDWVETHMASDIGHTYREIYNHTMRCIKMPEPAASTFQQTDGHSFFKSATQIDEPRLKVTPCLSVAELGYQLCKLGVLRPSGFGSFIDDAIISKKIIVSKKGDVSPGPGMLPQMDLGQRFSEILINLRSVADNPALKDETIRHILSS
jgi:DNA topoisomerase IA